MNNYRKDKKSNSKKKLSEINWKSSIFSSFKKSKSKSSTASGTKMGSLLNNGDVPAQEDVMLSSGLQRKRKSYEIFHWKFMLLSVLFVIGLCGTTIMWFTTIYSEEIFKTLTLGNGTKLHYAWKNPPLEPLLCVHVFNYTNAEEYFSEDNKKSKKVKLKVQETGPYCFRESIERTNIVFMKDGTEMSYREKRIHKFDTEFSNGSLNDTVFVPNVLILSVYKEIKNMLPITRYIAHSSLKTVGVQILIRIKVQDYLLGYRDDIFTIIGNLHAVFNGDEKHLPKEFGILQKRVGLSNDTVVIKTGNGNLDEMGQVIQINNITKFNAWTSNTCNLVTGSDGLFFRRSLVQSNQDVQLFHKDSCRSLPLYFSHTVQLRGGIVAHRYKLRPDIFDSRKIENECFYNASRSVKGYGVLEISTCSGVQGAPIVLSRPHLLDSNVNIDKNGEEIIEGLKPDLEKHDFHIDIFPPIGLTVRTLMRMQMNILVSNPTKDESLNPIEDNTVLPMVWVEMNSGNDVPEKMYSLLYHLSFTMKWAQTTLKWTFLLFTFLMAFILFKLSLMKSSSKKDFIIMSKKMNTSNNVVCNVYVPN